MFDHLLRALKDRLLAPVARRIGRRVSPLAITILAFAAGLAAAWCASRAVYGVALGLWWLNRALDGLDGTLARLQGRQTDFGGYLDIVLDFAVYAAIPVGLVIAVPGAAMAGCVLLASFFVNAAAWMYLSAILERRAAGAAARGELTTITMPPGLIAGAETIVFFSLFLLFPGALVPLFWTMTGLVALSALQRVVWAARHLTGDPPHRGPRT